MELTTYLEQQKVPFDVLHHPPAFTSQEVAAGTHVPGDEVAKVVVVRAGPKHYMLVLPASYHVRFDRLEKVLGSKNVRLATEAELSELFPDCDLGAMPPFGHEYGMEVYVDGHLADDESIVFEAGRHDEAVRMRWADYQRLAQPKIVEFAQHLH
jgi:Ala-tRNA(Pro) deacylase